MTNPLRVLMRRLLAATAVACTGFCLFWALVAILPAPARVLWVPSLAAAEAGLLVVALVLPGLGLAVLARRAGARGVALAAVAFGVAAILLSLIPIGQARKSARAEGVTLSLSGYLAGPSSIPDRAPTETRTYAGPGGEELKLDVWEPPGGASRGDQRPAVVMVHGGSWQAGERGETPRWDSWLAERGYVVFDVDYRLSPPPRWRDAPGDVRCAVGWVKRNAERYGVDPDRVVLMGRSAGGHLALLAAYAPDAPSALPPGCAAGDTSVAAVVAFYPPTDLSRVYDKEWPWWKPDLLGVGKLEAFTGGTPRTVAGRYRAASPVTHVAAGVPPTLLVHGGRDRLVGPEESRSLAGQLEATGVPHRLLELPYADHGFDYNWGGWGSQTTRPVLREFLERHLRPEAGTADVKPLARATAPPVRAAVARLPTSVGPLVRPTTPAVPPFRPASRHESYPSRTLR